MWHSRHPGLMKHTYTLLHMCVYACTHSICFLDLGSSPHVCTLCCIWFCYSYMILLDHVVCLDFSLVLLEHQFICFLWREETWVVDFGTWEESSFYSYWLKICLNIGIVFHWFQVTLSPHILTTSKLECFIITDMPLFNGILRNRNCLCQWISKF